MFKSLHFKSFLLFMLAMFMGGVNSAWAADKQNVSNVTTSFSATGNVTSNFTQSGDFTAATWSLDVTWKSGASWQSMFDKGSQVGSAKKPASSIILTGTNIPGTIKSVKVNSSVASDGATTVGVVVGSTTFQCNNANTATLQTSAADYTFTGEASGDVVLTWTQPSTSKAIYIKSVTITYEESDPSDTRADAELSFSSATASATIGQPFTAPTLSAATDFNGTVDYESSDESVAQIMDQETGEISLVGEGTATITATFAGNDDFKAGSASYTLTVTDNRIETTITNDNISLGLTEVATLTRLAPVVKDANDNVVAYTYGEWPTEVSFEIVSDENSIIGFLNNNSGEITLNSVEGTATLKAYYNFYGVSDTYKPSQCTFTITVEDMNAPGKVNNPYTVAQAIDNTPSSGTTANVYIKGIVSQFFGADITDDNYHRYYISDDGTTSTQLLVFGGKGLNNEAFSEADDLQIGDEVVIVGQLKTYSNAPEVAGDNYIVTLNRKELSSITLSGTYATSFVEGSEFNHDGVVVTATYSDQTTADVTSQAEFSTPDMTQVGEQTVTVSYGGQSTSYNITITEAPTHTATFSVNGTTSTEDFKEGAAITFPSVTAPTGYTFMGWTETAISTTQETAPGDLTSSATMGNADVTYYAVFAVGTGSGEDTYEQLTSQSFDANATYVIAGKQSSTVNTMYYLQSYDGTDVDVAWGVATTTPATATPVQFTLSGTASALVAQDNSGNYLICISAKKFAMSSTSTTVYLDEDGAIKSASDGNLLRYNYNTGNGGFRWYAGTTGTQAYFYKVIPGTTYSDYCTTIPTTVEITITAAGAASFSCDKALDFSQVEGITAYKATSKSDSYVHLDEVEQVPAGAGVIVKGAEGTYNVPVATGDVAELEGNLLVGTGENTFTVTSAEYGKVYKYVKTNAGVVGFQKAKVDWTCQAGHAYLMLPTTSAREYLNIFGEEPIDDVATGINSIDNEQLTIDNDAPAYNLAGQKVGKGYKGIVVKNGKKVVIK